MTEAVSLDNLMQEIVQEYESLSRQMKIIAKYIEQNKETLVLKRITEIAKDCDVQPSAIVRFAQRFRFSGFSEMQEVFRQAYAKQAVTPANYQQRIRKLIVTRDAQFNVGDLAREFIDASKVGLEELTAGLDDEALEAAVTMLQKAESIYVVGVRRAFPIASYIAYALQNVNKKVHLVSGLGGMVRQQIRSVGERDVVIAISFTPYGKETQHCLRIAQHHQAKTLIITDSNLSPLAKRANAVLLVNEGSSFAFRSLSATLCLCQALFIAVAYRLELKVDEIHEQVGFED